MEKQVFADAVRNLNVIFGDDLNNLSKAQSVLENTEKKRNGLERKLSTTSEETDKGIVHVLQESKRMAKETKSLSNVFSKCKTDLEEHLSRSKDTREIFTEKMQEIGQLLKVMRYLQWVLFLEEISQKIGEQLLQDRPQQAVESFLRLVTLWKNLQRSKCTNLLSHLTNSILYWLKIFKRQFGDELNKLLEQFHWPTTTPSSSPPSNPGLEALTKFGVVFNLLIQLQLPSELAAKDKSVDASYGGDMRDQLLPLQLMFAPFHKRFIYHFMKSRKTNRIDKPEWYLTQILAWIRDNSPFLEKYVQPLVDSAECDPVKVQVELMQTLVQITCNKLQSDKDIFLFDDALMTHHVDEVLLFVKELQGWGYTMPSPNVLNILTSEICFTKWLTLERKFAEVRMDQIFNTECAWKCRYPCTDDVDELKVPEFAESFMTMLLSMTERYQLLLSTKHQIKFLELQLKLLDDFRLRLLQLRNAETPVEPLSSKFCSILNAVHYITVVLNEWSNMPFFLKLHCSKVFLQIGKDEVLEQLSNLNERDLAKDADMLSGSVFEDTLSLLLHLKNDSMETLKKWILCDVKAKSRSYRTEKWFSITASQVTDLTTSAFLMLKVLKDNLHQAHEMISEPVFASVVSQLAGDVNSYIFEEVILQNLFSEGGALQLQKDINRNLIPIFGNYLDRPESNFREVKEACILLTLPKGSSMLLKEIIQGDSNSRESLAEQGIHMLNDITALRVLKQRTDM